MPSSLEAVDLFAPYGQHLLGVFLTTTPRISLAMIIMERWQLWLPNPNVAPFWPNPDYKVVCEPNKDEIGRAHV